MRLIELPILRRAAAIHFTSEAERREAVAACGEPAVERSCVIPVPVKRDQHAGNREEFIRRFPAAAGRKLILFLSRVDQKKGVELLFDAFVIVKHSEPNALLVIAGDGDTRYIDELRSRANRLGVAGDILWTGFIDRAEKANAYAVASVFVLPSHSENFGIAAAEALLAGVPCVLTDQVALTEYLDDSALVVPCDSDAVAGALGDVLSRSELRSRLAVRGRQVAERRFSLEAVGEALLDLYRSMVAPKVV
jgi:glycosyltransferase involved in cell wall biosynthesis